MQAQESARYTPDPFPRERVGSGDETRRVRLTQFGLFQLHQKLVLHHGTVVESLHVTGFT